MLNSDYKPMSCLQAGAAMNTLQLVLPKLVEATFFSKKIGLHRNELIMLRRLDVRKAQCLICIRKFLALCCLATAEQGQALHMEDMGGLQEEWNGMYPVWAEECLQLANDYQALHEDMVAHHKDGFIEKLLGLRLIIEGLQLTAMLMLSASQPDALEVLARYAVAAWQTGMQAECITCNEAEEEAVHSVMTTDAHCCVPKPRVAQLLHVHVANVNIKNPAALVR